MILNIRNIQFPVRSDMQNNMIKALIQLDN